MWWYDLNIFYTIFLSKLQKIRTRQGTLAPPTMFLPRALTVLEHLADQLEHGALDSRPGFSGRALKFSTRPGLSTRPLHSQRHLRILNSPSQLERMSSQVVPCILDSSLGFSARPSSGSSPTPLDFQLDVGILNSNAQFDLVILKSTSGILNSIL